ncbi:ABC transporter substrate-binding protein [Caproicibacter sp.]|uniref:ABC transporter substrate-binding protein n=1 Tax=Caproicibacter sp. TaxID=2814884 RepID=UPI003989B971
MKKELIGFFSVVTVLCLVFAGCASGSAAQAASQPATASSSAAGPSSKDAGQKTRVFTDSAGRSVTVPSVIRSAAPSGPLAQIVLYTVAPDKLAGLASNFSADAKKYIDQKYWSLPKFGQFYGKNASLNLEALTAAAPDVIIDVGEAKKTIREDMDGLQKQLNIPTVFIEATLDDMDRAYTMLGDLLGESDRAAKLAQTCGQTIKNADEIASGIPQNQRIRVYMATGDAGLNTNAAGSIHADVLERVGAVNVANVQAVSSGGGSEISFEQLLSWNPDVILADSEKLYQRITSDSAWASLKAVKDGKVYRIPSTPYSFLGNPPSVNRVVGIDWLGNLLYPDKYQMDLKKKICDFYSQFYSISLTDEQFASIMQP